MDINKIATFVVMMRTATDAGLVVAGGVKALASLFGHDLTIEEQNAILVADTADAIRRGNDRRRMAGIPE